MKKQQSALIATLTLVVCGLTSVILIVLSAIHRRLGFHYLRLVLGIVAAYVMAAVWPSRS